MLFYKNNTISVIAIAIQQSGGWACPSSSSKLHSLHENGAVARPRIHRVGRVGLQKCQPIFRIQSKPSLSTLIKISLRPLGKHFQKVWYPAFHCRIKVHDNHRPGFLAYLTPRFGLSPSVNSPVPIKGPEARAFQVGWLSRGREQIS